MGGTVTYKTFPIDRVKCVDKKGRPVVLENKPSLEIRFTDIKNNEYVFYFDLISVHDDYVTGSESRFFPNDKHRLSLKSIKKIEIQDGRKRFSYVY